MKLKDYVKERNTALFSLDEATIRNFTRKYGLRELSPNPKVFWGAVYKAVLNTQECPADVAEKARSGLKRLGMSEQFR